MKLIKKMKKNRLYCRFFFIVLININVIHDKISCIIKMNFESISEISFIELTQNIFNVIMRSCINSGGLTAFQPFNAMVSHIKMQDLKSH